MNTSECLINASMSLQSLFFSGAQSRTPWRSVAMITTKIYSNPSQLKACHKENQSNNSSERLPSKSLLI